MNSQNVILELMRSQGRADALDLRGRAPDMDGTAIIAEEVKIPAFDPAKDYSLWPVGAPVTDEVDGELQVFTLLQPYNASHYPDSRPANAPALWSITHTKDPARAKAWLAPNGTSGLYMTDEVCTDPQAEDSAAVYRSKVDGNVYPPSAQPQDWERVE